MLVLFSLIFFHKSSCYYFTGYHVRDLEKNDTSFAYDTLLWTASALGSSNLPYTVCSGSFILGGPGALGLVGYPSQGQYFERIYTELPLSHTMIYFSFTLWILDTWDGSLDDLFQVRFDERFLNGWPFDEIGFPNDNLCGIGPGEDLGAVRVFGKVFHTSNTLRFKVISQLDQWGDDESFGIRDLKLLFVNNPITTRESFCGITSLPMKYGQCSCPEGYYESPVGSNLCLQCNSRCKSCFGPGASSCYECADNAYFNGQTCLKCYKACATCSGEGVNQCLSCKTGNFMINGGFTCVEKCETPLVPQYIGTVGYCTGPTCLSPNFLFWDGSCRVQSNCAPPLLQSFISTFRICEHPCGTNQFLYWNGSCFPTCSSPFIASTSYGGKKLCKVNCASGDFLIWDGSCNSTCVSPLSAQIQDGQSVCVFPCNQNEFLYHDGSCQSTCDMFFVSSIWKGRHFCNYPCSSSQYLSWLGNCKYTCDFPLRPIFQSKGNLCLSPCESADEYYYEDLGICQKTCSSLSGFDSQYQYLKCYSNEVTIPLNQTIFTKLFIPPTNPNDVSFFSLVKLIYPLRFLNIPLPSRLEALVLTRGRSPLWIRLPQSLTSEMISDFPLLEIPDIFIKRGLHSSFIVNIWPELTTWFIALFILFVSTFLERAFKKLEHKFPQMICERFRVVLGWNFLIILVATGLDDLILFSILEIQAAGLNTFLGTLSFVICLFSIAGVGILLFKILKIVPLSRYAATKNSPLSVAEVIAKKQNYQIAFKSLRENNYFNKLFFLIYALRIGLPMLITACFYSVPLLQTILYIIVTLLMIFSLAIFKPIRSLINHAQILTLEGLILLINIFMLTLTILDIQEKSNTRIAGLIGDLIMIVNDIINIMLFVFFIIKIFKGVKKAYEIRKKEDMRIEIEAWLQILFLPLQQGCMGFETTQITRPPELDKLESSPKVKRQFNRGWRDEDIREKQKKSPKGKEKWSFEYLRAMEEDVQVFRKTGVKSIHDDSGMDLIRILSLGDTQEGSKGFVKRNNKGLAVVSEVAYDNESPISLETAIQKELSKNEKIARDNSHMNEVDVVDLATTLRTDRPFINASPLNLTARTALRNFQEIPIQLGMNYEEKNNEDEEDERLHPSKLKDTTLVTKENLIKLHNQNEEFE